MNATRISTAPRGSMLVLLCLLALIAASITVSTPDAVYADGNGEDTIQYEDSSGVGKSSMPEPNDPETNPIIKDARVFTQIVQTLWTVVW